MWPRLPANILNFSLKVSTENKDTFASDLNLTDHDILPLLFWNASISPNKIPIQSQLPATILNFLDQFQLKINIIFDLILSKIYWYLTVTQLECSFFSIAIKRYILDILRISLLWENIKMTIVLMDLNVPSTWQRKTTIWSQLPSHSKFQPRISVFSHILF